MYIRPCLVFPIIHGSAGSRANFQALVYFLTQFLPIFITIFDPIYPLVQVAQGSVTAAADLIPLDVTAVIPVVLSLGIGWVSTTWHNAHGINDEAGDQGAVGVG